jgi:hypothetical protein
MGTILNLSREPKLFRHGTLKKMDGPRIITPFAPSNLVYKVIKLN